MADWTAITGIVVAGVVGPGLGAWAASSRLGREHVHDRGMADREELRELLDSAAQHVKRTGRLHGALPTLFLTHGRHLPERAGKHIEMLNEAGREVDLDSARLELRLGTESPVVVAHRDAFRVLLDTSNVLASLHPDDVETGLRETRDALDDAREAYALAEERFMATAHGLAAARLDA